MRSKINNFLHISTAMFVDNRLSIITMITSVLYVRTAASARSIAATCGMIALVLSFMSVSSPCLSQSSDEQKVKDVMAQLFKGMELGDSAMVHRCFMPQVTMATVKISKEGGAALTREGSLSGFLRAVGTPHAEKWYEEIWDVRVSIDGTFAQVWCDYGFYLGNKFSHCGVDAFHLYKDGAQWKIFHLADTRKSTGCDIPADIAKKHAP